MNKTALIVGGASVASLAVGATGGYFYAVKRLTTQFDEKLDNEIAETKKHYSLLLMQAQKPASPADIPRHEEEPPGADVELEDDHEELTPEDQAAIAKGRESLAAAKRALTDYNGVSKKPSSGEVVENNIFSNNKTKTLPPRDPTNGKFLPKGATPARQAEQTPYQISQEDYLLNDGEYEQKTLLYFRKHNTLIDKEDTDQVVEISEIGEVLLTLFPDVPEDEASIICVRNEWLERDYEITATDEDLTEFYGLGENDGGEEVPDEYDDEDEDDELNARSGSIYH